MKFREFIKDKWLLIVLVLCGLISIEIFLIPYPFSVFIKLYIPISLIFLMLIGFWGEYFVKNNFYHNFSTTLEELEEKYLITEIVKTPHFSEGKLFKSWLEDIDKSMHEHVNQYRYRIENYKEYIELWIHEIKLPIATSKMIIENNKNLITKSMDEELRKS